jgi:hypothetical protein
LNNRQREVLRSYYLDALRICMNCSLCSDKKKLHVKLYPVIPFSQVFIFKLQIHLCGVQVRMPQQLLHLPEVRAESDKVDRKAVSERVGVDANVDHAAVLLDDVPDMGARGGENGLRLWMLCVDIYSESGANVSGSSIIWRCSLPFAFVILITWMCGFRSSGLIDKSSLTLMPVRHKIRSIRQSLRLQILACPVTWQLSLFPDSPQYSSHLTKGELSM